MQDKEVQLIAKQRKYKGFFAIDEYVLKHTKFNGQMSNQFSRELFERGNASAVLLYDPLLDKVVLIEQFRIGAYVARKNPWLLELVAGIDEPGECPEDVVKREAFEEAGSEHERLRHRERPFPHR